MGQNLVGPRRQGNVDLAFLKPAYSPRYLQRIAGGPARPQLPFLFVCSAGLPPLPAGHSVAIAMFILLRVQSGGVASNSTVCR